MKILQVNCVYNVGSTGKIMYDIHTELQKQNIESVICYGRGEKTSDKNVYKTCGEFYSHVNHFFANLTGVLYGGCLLSTSRLISRIKKENPDIVHLHCINGYFVNIYRLIKWLKKMRIRTVLTLHAEFMYTGGCGHALDCTQWCDGSGCDKGKCPVYKSDMGSWLFDRSSTMWRRMKKAFSGFDKDRLTIVSVSPWLMSRAQQSDILGEFGNTYVLNGLDTTIFYARENNTLSSTSNDKKMVLHVTPSFDDNPDSLKGGHFVIELARRFESDPGVCFVVAGNYAEIQDLPSNLTLLGRVSDKDELADLYSSADVTVITSKKETFSMVVAESLCCGTPAVGFYAGGPESIAIEEYTKFVDYGDIDALEFQIKEFLNNDYSKQKIADVAADKYSKDSMLRGYMSVYSGGWSV